jgi:hypothetical protein
MPQMSAKTLRTDDTAAKSGVPSTQKGAVLPPPRYGIDFVDRKPEKEKAGPKVISPRPSAQGADVQTPALRTAPTTAQPVSKPSIATPLAQDKATVAKPLLPLATLSPSLAAPAASPPSTAASAGSVSASAKPALAVVATMPVGKPDAPTTIGKGAEGAQAGKSATGAPPPPSFPAQTLSRTSPASEQGAGSSAAEAVQKTEAGAENPSAVPARIEPVKVEAPQPDGEAATKLGEGTIPVKEGGQAKPIDTSVQLHIPEPPAGPSPAALGRIQGIQARVGKVAATQASLPSGANQVGNARQAVTEPDVAALAKAQAELISLVQAAPSPEIVKLCERIRAVIRNKRPPDEDALMEAKPDEEALAAGNQLNSTVNAETQKVQDNYAAVDKPPPATTPVKGQELPPQPQASPAPPVNAPGAAPDAVPPENVSLDADVGDNRQKMTAAGMDTPSAQLVQSGPIAEARGAQGELEQAAKEDPAKVLATQKECLGKAENDMALLQAQALSALTHARAATTKDASSRQKGMVGSEASMQAEAGIEAKKIFDDAKTQVQALLKPLSANAITEWESAKEILVTQFKSDLAVVQKRVEERHAGVGGFVVGLWDAVTGLPAWAEEAYTKAEKNFGDGVIAKLESISTKVNAVIATCDLIIKTAQERIAKVFADLPESLQTWAKQEQGKFDGQLDQLHNEAIAARDNFNKDLINRSSQAVDAVRTEIHELRQKAAGLVGRIVNAIGRFLDDPVKFIIEGLLELLGIQPASFWAVVAKIKKFAKDIANNTLLFANNLLSGLSQGFSQFFDNFGQHILKGFIAWLTAGLGDVGVQLPQDFSLKSIVTFLLQLMGITWARIRKILAKLVGEKNVALLEKVYTLVSFLIDKGPEGIFEMIKEKLDPQSIVDQVVQLAVDFLVSAIVKQVSVRIVLLFNPAGAILQALEAIYRVLKWLFQNAARIFTLIETVVNGLADIMAGNIGGFATAVEKALGMLIAPVISFIADYLGLGDIPSKIADKIKSFQEWILGLIEKALTWLVEKGKSLLAALGIGKKEKKPEKEEDDESVGEDVTWDVGTEGHHLWIEPWGDGYITKVASAKQNPVGDALEEYSLQAKELEKTDKKRANNAKAAIPKARKALQSLGQALDKVTDLTKKSAPKDQIKAAKKLVKERQKALGDIVKEIQTDLGLLDDPRIKLARNAFKQGIFSTNRQLAPLLGLSERRTREIVAEWKESGSIFRIESSESDPGGLCTFDPAKAEYREVDQGNREKYGYRNPKKTSDAGMTILSKGLRRGNNPALDSPKPIHEKAPAYHQDKAKYHSTRPGSVYADKSFGFDLAILGHHVHMGASAHWNKFGHKQSKSDNLAWNQDPDHYHGPEHEIESAASGSLEPRYIIPHALIGSHSSWL